MLSKEELIKYRAELSKNIKNYHTYRNYQSSSF